MKKKKKEYWSGLPSPLPGDLPNPGMEPTSLVSSIGKQILYHSRPLGSPLNRVADSIYTVQFIHKSIFMTPQITCMKKETKHFGFNKV